MKFYEKLAKLCRREAHRRGWRRAKRSIFRLPLGPVLADIDQNRLAEIQKRGSKVFRCRLLAARES